MSFDSFGAWWLIAAAVLGAAELLLPGVFLIFLAAAAAVTGAVVLLFPELPVAAQLLSFGAWCTVTVLIGRRWYVDAPVASSDPMLNDRVARLIGQTVILTQAIEHGEGRARVGDSEWLVRGDDAPAGARVRVTGATGGALSVTPLPPPEGSSAP
jgi:membrane protein implicated in regulation of membrane protease activity